MAVAVVVVFYILGFVLNIVFDFILDIGSVAPFFYLFGDYWDSSASTAGRVIAEYFGLFLLFILKYALVKNNREYIWKFITEHPERQPLTLKRME